MKLGRVLGNVVLNHALPELQGARWLVVSPCGRAELEDLSATRVGREPSLVVYDNLGAATGSIIGYTEGAEAAHPFDSPTPVDAYCAAIIDQVFFHS